MGHSSKLGITPLAAGSKMDTKGDHVLEARSYPRPVAAGTPVAKYRLSAGFRRHALIWLAWTVAGLFYFTQDFAPRLYRNERLPWRDVLAGWMAAMYICAAFTPAILWLGRRWPIGQGRRWRWAG